ncbi:MAG: HAMP domain-containing protein [Lachnospiraceae bacterium]|nr:HAMP domain-containing protein [Lachnospiraceae bacterium]
MIMKRLKIKKIKSLYLELALSVFGVLAIGIVLYLAFDSASSSFTDSSYIQGRWSKEQQLKSAESLQTYISDNKLSSEDLDAVEEWSSKNNLVYFFIEKNSRIIYDSTIYYLLEELENNELNEDVTEDDIYDLSYFDSYSSNYASFNITFSDGAATLYLFGDYSYGLYSKLRVLSLILATTISVLLILFVIRTKIQYINEITKGIHILEGGNLDYQIPLKGSDELTQVAESLNSMSSALTEQIENEKNAIRANASLVTALSHDLRTPLTTQMGYLEILKEHRYKSDAEMEQYLTTALATCNEIKTMSDRLFEYFLAFDPHPDKPEGGLEEYDALEVFMQLLAEHIIPLKSEGYKIHVIEPESSFLVNINIEDVVRVFNNVFSNIDKYADENTPILVEIIKEGALCNIVFTNKIRMTPRKNESSKIGLESIAALMYRQGGSSTVKTKDGNFILELTFPIKELS